MNDVVMYMGEVLHDEPGEHDADVEQDRLHGVVPHEVRHRRVPHHGQEQGEERHERDERVAVEDLEQRRDGERYVDANRVRHERLARERDRAHARDEVRQQR